MNYIYLLRNFAVVFAAILLQASIVRGTSFLEDEATQCSPTMCTQEMLMKYCPNSCDKFVPVDMANQIYETLVCSFDIITLISKGVFSSEWNYMLLAQHCIATKTEPSTFVYVNAQVDEVGEVSKSTDNFQDDKIIMDNYISFFKEYAKLAAYESSLPTEVSSRLIYTASKLLQRAPSYVDDLLKRERLPSVDDLGKVFEEDFYDKFHYFLSEKGDSLQKLIHITHLGLENMLQTLMAKRELQPRRLQAAPSDASSTAATENTYIDDLKKFRYRISPTQFSATGIIFTIIFGAFLGCIFLVRIHAPKDFPMQPLPHEKEY